MIKIKPIQERLLTNLAIYKFLTIKQCEDLHIGHKSKIKVGLNELTKLEFIKFVQYSFADKKGNAHRVHFLTHKGVKALLTAKDTLNINDIKYPKSHNSIFRHDYFHRISTINTQIACYNWTKKHNFTLSFFERYFDKVGSSRNQSITGLLHGATRLSFENGNYVEPDAVFMVEKQNINHLFVLEVFNGNDSKRVVEQLKKLSQAIIEGLASDKYNHNAPAKVLCTFEFESNMKAVIKRLQAEDDFQYEGIEKYFFFSLAEST